MKLHTFFYKATGEWSVEEFPDLDSEQTLVMVFASSDFIDNPAALSELSHAYPKSIVIGCSTAGEIIGSSVNDASLSVAVLQFEKSSMIAVHSEITQTDDSLSVGEKLASQLQRKGLRGVFVLSDGLIVNGSKLVKGINSVLPPGVIVTGGLAADGDRFGRTWVIRDGRPQTGMIAAVGFYGDSLRITHGSCGGWDGFGPQRWITRSKGNVLYELDGKPALALYKEYLGARVSGLPATALLFPLSIRENATDARQLVRTILSVDEVTQSMTFAGDIPNGYRAQLMRANFDRLVKGASIAASQAHENASASGPVLAVAISCVGRRLVMGERIDEEVEATLEILSDRAQQIGFYSYGEISPYESGYCDLHNQTMTLTTFSEI